MNWFRVLVASVIGGALLLGLVGPTSQAMAAGAERKIPLSAQTVLVDGKDDQAVRVGETPFRITSQTLIRTAAGERLSIQLLPVPCRARIVYYYPEEGQSAQAVEIIVLPTYPE